MTLLRSLVQPWLDYCLQPGVVPLQPGQYQPTRGCPAQLYRSDPGPSVGAPGLLGKAGAAPVLQPRAPAGALHDLPPLEAQLRAEQRLTCQVAVEQPPGTVCRANTPGQVLAHYSPVDQGAFRGARIFNLLPASICNKEGDFYLFKNHLNIARPSQGRGNQQIA